MSTTDHFPADTAGLPEATSPEVVELADGAEFDLHLAPVARRFGDATVRMLAYNGSIPGPTLRVQQGSELVVHVVNHGDMETTVHWHGLRLTTASMGRRRSQQPVPVGGRFTYRVQISRPRRLLVPPARPRGLRPGDGAVRQRSSSSPRIPSYWPRATASWPSRSTTSSSKMERSHRSADPRRRTRRWAASGMCCSSTARPSCRSQRRLARSCAST